MKSLGKKRLLKHNIKFAGPLKVWVIDPKQEYYKTITCAVGLGIATVMIGAVNMAVLIFSVQVGHWHGILCTVAYHFFCVEGILSLNYASGWSTPMRLRHRKVTHVVLQICAAICAVIGTTLVLTSNGVTTTTPHGIAGMTTGALAIVNMLGGPCAWAGCRIPRIIHMTFGMLCFITSSISLCLAFFTNSFKNWAHLSIIITLICFICFYTFFILGTVFIKCLNRI